MSKNEKIQSVTLEFETYSKTLKGEWAEKWLSWVNGEIQTAQIRTGSISMPAGLHDNWIIKTKKQIRKEKLQNIENEKR